MRMGRYVHNRRCMPQLETEGVFDKSLVAADRCGRDTWTEGLTPFQRMHMHQTLASVRRFVHFHPFSVPKDELDLVLTTSYNHSEEQFPDQIDVYLQPETVNQITWRKLRNLRKLEPIRTKIMSRIAEEEQENRKPPYKYNYSHPVLIGGVIEKVHPSNVKLMNSSHHTSQTNAGYSRQDSDGNLYQY